MNLPGKIVKHSIMVAGHSTSVSLETAFWDCIQDLASRRAISVAGLVAQIDAQRGTANLSSAIRVHVLEALRDAASRGNAASA